MRRDFSHLRDKKNIYQPWSFGSFEGKIILRLLQVSVFYREFIKFSKCCQIKYELLRLSVILSHSVCTIYVCVSLEVNDVLKQVQRCKICFSYGFGFGFPPKSVKSSSPPRSVIHKEEHKPQSLECRHPN